MWIVNFSHRQFYVDCKNGVKFHNNQRVVAKLQLTDAKTGFLEILQNIYQHKDDVGLIYSVSDRYMSQAKETKPTLCNNKL